MLVGLASAKVGIKTGVDFNAFGDSRVSGQSTNVELLFDVTEDMVLSYKVSSGDLVVNDARTSANNFLLKTKINSLNFSRVVAMPVKNMPISVGLELGTLTTTALAGTVAAPVTASQTVPLAGLNGTISYETGSDNGVKTICSFMLGYRFADINDVAIPAFTAGNQNLNDLNAITFGVQVGLKF